MSIEKSTLYVVATPIGNLGDLGARGREVLVGVDLIAAEDTRHSRPLLEHYGISTPMVALHEHNETAAAPGLVARIAAGESMALISDAGTPLVSDPGYRMVQEAITAGVTVVPVPGACAAIAALSVSGLPTDRWSFEGFLPSKQTARVKTLKALANDSRTLVFYESSHRIEASIGDMAGVFGDDRSAVIARELTKRFETVARGSLDELKAWLSNDTNQRKGEFVVLIGARSDHENEDETRGREVMEILMRELPIKKAAALAAEISGLRRNRLYDIGLEISG